MGSEELTHALADVTERFNGLVDRAAPTAKKIESLIRVGGLLGLIGGLAGAAGLALPGVGLTRSWGFFLLLALIAIVCAAVVRRWAGVLGAWRNDVARVVETLQDLPDPSAVAKELRSHASAMRGSQQEKASAVRSLVRSARDLRSRLRDIPGGALKAKELFVELTGPFRPPMFAIRLALLVGGLVMVVIGPAILLLALIV